MRHEKSNKRVDVEGVEVGAGVGAGVERRGRGRGRAGCTLVGAEGEAKEGEVGSWLWVR